MENSSAKNMWQNYLDKHLDDVHLDTPKTIHFYDNEKDANFNVELTVAGTKTATTDSLIGLQNRDEKLPKIGDYTVVTNWDGKAQCILKTTKVVLKPYFSIDNSYAQKEGDQSLEQWKKKSLGILH